MNQHEEIKAKGAPEWITLFAHLMQVKIVAESFAHYCGLDISIAGLGAILHDIGKVHPVFQQQLNGIKPKQTFRHELASLFFLPLVPMAYKEPILEMIVAHHKSIQADGKGKGILDLEEYEYEPVQYHLGNWEKWSIVALDILESFGFEIRIISKEEAITAWNEVVNYCNNAFQNKRGYSKWRGLLMGADYFASSQIDNTADNIKKAFAPPQLQYFERQGELYPLSYKDAKSDKPHTMVVASTGAGKTDYLFRRCKGRVFYTLPFQASINAMYQRIKRDLKPTNPNLDIRVLHAASSLIAKDDEETDTSLQELIGASVKILTPYQLAGIAFGSKGYESIILDLKGCDVILDEVHTYSGISQAIVLKIVAVLKEIGCRVHIGTATMPSVLYKKIKEILGEENVLEVALTPDELLKFNRHQVHKLESWESVFSIIANAVKNKTKVLVVCNRVDQAQEVFGQLQEAFPDTEKLLLHSRFKRKDRNQKEAQLLGIDKDGNPLYEFNTSNEACIVVSTQIVEVSLDISFDVMITECAPLDALIQRFGRINRKRHKSTIGNLKPVYVIAPPDDEKKAKPYDLTILQKSFAVLPNNEVLAEADLQKKIDEVFTHIDFMTIETHSVFKENGNWSIALLTHSSPMLMDLLEIDSVVCITESDYGAYEKTSFEDKMLYEIPARPYAVKKFPRPFKTGKNPYLIPNSAYSELLGMSLKDNPDDQIL